MHKQLTLLALLWSGFALGDATFTNSDGTGWDQNSTTSSGPDAVTMTLPSEATDGNLVMIFFGQDDADASGNTLTVTSITGEVTDIVASDGDIATGMVGYWEQGASPPSTVDINDSGPSSEQINAGIVAITDYDDGTIIKGTSTSNTGTGTTITYPSHATTATSDDLVFRFAVFDDPASISSTPGTQVFSAASPTSFNVAIHLAFETGSGSAPSTDTATLSTSEEWVAFTVIVAGNSGGASVAPLAEHHYRQQRQ